MFNHQWQKRLSSSIFLLFLFFNIFSQSIPSHRLSDWTLAGFRGDQLPNPSNVLNIMDFGAIPDSTTDNSLALQNAISALSNTDGVILFPAGNYFFSSKITISDGLVLRGEGSDQTTLSFDLGGVDDLINVKGSATNIFSDFTENSLKNDYQIQIENSDLFSPGDYIRIIQTDTNLVFSSWAIGSVGQIVKINQINGNTLLLDSELRKDFQLVDSPKVQKLNMIKNTGIECLNITRQDETNPIQTSAIKYQYAVQSWVSGVESENCNFAHITIASSSNITVTGSYFHHAFDYGGGGRAYGVMIQGTGNENLIQNNVFEHLRHSMIAQSGANGNVFSYNYSIDPFWTGTTLPSNSAGDIVCHGNYPFANLFEGNIGQQIVIDNSHGTNGPYNTFIRNRLDLYGIVMSADNSPSQNFIGNEITDGTIGALGFYLLQGVDHFEQGNNHVNEIIPEGTSAVGFLSAYLPSAPSFFPNANFPTIGMPNLISSGNIPAQIRKIDNENITVCSHPCLDDDEDTICNFADNCLSTSNESQQDEDQDGVGNECDNCIDVSNFDQLDSDGNGVGDACEVTSLNDKELNKSWTLFPNPTKDGIFLDLKAFNGKHAIIQIFSPLGEIVFRENLQITTDKQYIDLDGFNIGIYSIRIQVEGEQAFSKHFHKLKTN